MELAEQLHLSVERKYEIAESVPETVLAYAAHTESNLLLLGASVNLSQDEKDRDLVAYKNKLTRRWGLLTGASKAKDSQSSKHPFEELIATFAQEAPCSVGIYVDNGQTEIAHPLVLIQRLEDQRLLSFAEQLVRDEDCAITLVPLSSHLPKPSAKLPPQVEWRGESFGEQMPLEGYDFALIAYDAWSNLSTQQQELLKQFPSYLILDIDEATIQLPVLQRPIRQMIPYLGKSI